MIYIYNILRDLSLVGISTSTHFLFGGKQQIKNVVEVGTTGMLHGKRNFTKKRGYREELFTSNLDSPKNDILY